MTITIFKTFENKCLILISFFIDRWTDIPGGPLWYGSYKGFNDSYHSENELSDLKGFVLMSTKFNNKANISAIEFVPMNAITNGKLIIEVYIILVMFYSKKHKSYIGTGS